MSRFDVVEMQSKSTLRSLHGFAKLHTKTQGNRLWSNEPWDTRFKSFLLDTKTQGNRLWSNEPWDTRFKSFLLDTSDASQFLDVFLQVKGGPGWWWWKGGIYKAG